MDQRRGLLPRRQTRPYGIGGHADYVLSVAFPPDGRTLLTASDDNTVQLWDAATGDSIRTFSGLTGPIAFSQDGSRILTGRKDERAILCDLATGAELQSFIGHADDITSVAFSPDGLKVYTGSLDKTVRRWNAATGICEWTFTGYTFAITSLDISSDGNLLVTGSMDGLAKLWPVAGGPEIRNFAGGAGSVRSVAFSPDDAKIVTGSTDYTAMLWDTGVRAPTRLLPEPAREKPVFRVTRPNGSTLRVSSNALSWAGESTFAIYSLSGKALARLSPLPHRRDNLAEYTLPRPLPRGTYLFRCEQAERIVTGAFTLVEGN